jgi:hypothetical protein
MGRREWTTCFTVTAFGVIGLYKLVMTLGDDPDMVTITGLATVIDGDTLKVGFHINVMHESVYLSARSFSRDMSHHYQYLCQLRRLHL